MLQLTNPGARAASAPSTAPPRLRPQVGLKAFKAELPSKPQQPEQGRRVAKYHTIRQNLLGLDLGFSCVVFGLWGLGIALTFWDVGVDTRTRFEAEDFAGSGCW